MHSVHPVGAGNVSCIAFEGARRIAAGELRQIVPAIKQVIDAGSLLPLLVFDARSSHVVEVDFRGSVQDVLGRLPSSAGTADQAGIGAAATAIAAQTETARGRGRPKLGVIGREVTLLPRHWDWLGSQPGGASVALRKLVEQARRANEGRDRIRLAQESAYRFISIMASAEPGFEEASRALFGGDAARFAALIRPWPGDVRQHAAELAAAAFRVGEAN